MESYVDALAALDEELIGLRAQLEIFEVQKKRVHATFVEQLSDHVERLKDSSNALFTDETAASEARIIAYSQQYHHSNFAILSNAKLTIQLIQARTQTSALKAQLESVLGRNDLQYAIKLLCTAFEASRLLNQDFSVVQKDALQCLDDYVTTIRSLDSFRQDAPILVYLVSRWHSSEDYIAAFQIATEPEIPAALNPALKLMSQYMQASTDQFRALSRLLTVVYSNQYYHQLTFIFHKEPRFAQFALDSMNRFVAETVAVLHRFVAVFEASSEEPVFKLQFLQTCMSLLTRYFTLLGQEEARINRTMELQEGAFLLTTYQIKEFPARCTGCEKSSISVLLARLSGVFLTECSAYLQSLRQVCADEDLLGNQLFSALQFMNSSIASIDGQGALNLENLKAQFVEIALNYLNAEAAQFSLQTAYYLHSQLSKDFAAAFPALQERIQNRIAAEAEALVQQLEPQIYKFATLADAFALVEALGNCDALAQKTPWFSRFCDMFFTKLNETLYQTVRKTKVKNIKAASASLNLLQAKYTEIMHIGSASYFVKLRQFMQISGAVTSEEVFLIAEEAGDEWVISKDEMHDIIKACGIE